MILSKIIKPLYIIADKPICNSSLLHLNNEDYLIARYSNYSCGKYLNSVNYYCDGNIFTDEIIYKIDFKNGTTNFVKYLTKTSNGDKKKYTSIGFEDIRIVNWNNTNVITTILDKNHICQVYKYDLLNDFSLKNGDTIKTQNKIEKNWQPIENKPLVYVYSYKPFKLFDFNTKKFISIDNNCYNFSGSSQIIKINENHNLTIVHTRNNRTYTHYFILFDNNLNIVKISNGFSFIGIDVEFNCFIKKCDDLLQILVGINDSNTLLFNVPITLLYDIIYDKINNECKIDNDIIKEMYYKNNHLLSKLCLATYSNDDELLSNAIILNHNCNLNIKLKEKIQTTLLNSYKG